MKNFIEKRVGLSSAEAFPYAAHEQSPYFRVMQRQFRQVTPDIDESRFDTPNVSPAIFEILRQLVLYETEDLTIFHGGKLDLGDSVAGEHWLMPVAVHMNEEGDRPIQLHAILSNIEFMNQTIDKPSEINFQVSLATETEMKLLAMKQEEVDLYNILTEGSSERRIIVRPVTMGNIAYPMITTPRDLPVQSVIRGAIQKFAAFFGIDARDRIPRDIGRLYDEIRPEIRPRDFNWPEEGIVDRLKNFQILEPIVVATPKGNVFVYNVYPKDDVWGMYQIMSFEPITELRKRKAVTVRPDSGCESGMLYHDDGCECHLQFLDALDIAQRDGGFVLHFPTQDGRGYGTALKMETELLKQGRRSAMFPTNFSRHSTIDAAKAVFGRSQWDIRRYYYPGLLMYELGFKNVLVYTDNVQKIAELTHGSSSRVNFTRIGTNAAAKSMNNPDLALHISSKHDDKRYFSDDPISTNQ
ncbi:MAG: hypothetical protein WCL07_04615 [bacterium]